LLRKPETFFETAYGIPAGVCQAMVREPAISKRSRFGGKREIRKDPIAVGLCKNGNRYLLCRWGIDKLIPFEEIRKRSWLYHIKNFGVVILASEKFWISTIAATIFAIAYVGMW